MQDYSPSFHPFSHSKAVVGRVHLTTKTKVLVSNIAKKYAKKYRW